MLDKNQSACLHVFFVDVSLFTLTLGIANFPFYAPNFEKAEEAYCFGCVRPCVRACVRASVTSLR